MDFGVAIFPTHDARCLVIERDAITTAKEVASIDALSGGRVEFGVGTGWNREEMAHPPVLVGGYGPTVLDRVLAFGDA